MGPVLAHVARPGVVTSRNSTLDGSDMGISTFPWENDIGLVVADIPWKPFLEALRDTSGEAFVEGEAVTDWMTWRQECPDERTATLLAGEHQGRTYVMADNPVIVPAEADRIVALAAATDGMVLGHTYMDSIASGEGVAARGMRLLRYVVDSQYGKHEEGELLPGETSDYTLGFPYGFRDVIAALGFDVDGWLEHGTKRNVFRSRLDRDEQPEAWARVYRGPLRQRTEWIDEVAREDF